MKGTNSLFELAGEHIDMVKSIKLSPDGMVCFSASSDGTLKMWDLSMRKCIQTVGDTTHRKISEFHRDSITTFDVTSDQDMIFTGGRDGTIF